MRAARFFFLYTPPPLCQWEVPAVHHGSWQTNVSINTLSMLTHEKPDKFRTKHDTSATRWWMTATILIHAKINVRPLHANTRIKWLTFVHSRGLLIGSLPAAVWTALCARRTSESSVIHESKKKDKVWEKTKHVKKIRKTVCLESKRETLELLSQRTECNRIAVI